MRRWLVVPFVAAIIAACATPSASHQPPPPSNQPPAEQDRPAVLFYAKSGSIYVSDPPGTPGRRLTDGPADTEPAPSPDGRRVAFVRKQTRDDYGGELWVLDLTASGAPAGTPRRLVDPADVGPMRRGEFMKVGTPRWSPTGERIAFLWATPTPAGSLMTAAADTGAVLIGREPPWVDRDYAWAPDGRRIAWVTGRSDVRPAEVGVLTVGGSSTVVARGTNSSGVAFADGGKTVLFANGDSTDPGKFTRNPFELKVGGIYSVPADGGAAAPAPLVSGSDSYTAVAELDDGAVAFAVSNSGRPGASGRAGIEIFQPGEGAPEVLADYDGGPLPVWSPKGVVAYIGGAEGRSLMIMDREDRIAKRVDTGAEAIAWSG